MRTDQRRILIVRPSALGDVCRSVAVLWSLREAFPDATIDWVVEDRWADAVRGHPAVNEVIEFPKRRFRGALWNPVVGMEAISWFARLSVRRYDTVIDAQGLARSALMSLCTRAPTRIASKPSLEFAWIAANVRVEADPSMHVVDRMLGLVEAAGAKARPNMRLVATPRDIDSCRALRDRVGIAGRYIVVAAANRWEGKRWKSERWRAALAELSGDLQRAGVTAVCWIGGPGEDHEVAGSIPDGREVAAIVHHNLAGMMTVGETMALVASSSLVISLDSAPAHMAVGFGVPVIALFGASKPETDGPYGHLAWCLHGGRGERLEARGHRAAAQGTAMMDRIEVAALVSMVRRRLDSEGMA